MAFFVRYGPVNRSLKLESESFESLLALIKKEFALANEAFHLSYFDEEHEKISVSCWNDFKVAVEEHSVMKKVVQLYIEQGDAEDAEDDDLVVINNSPNVTTKQVLAVAADAQSQTATVDRRDVPTQTAVAAKDEKNDEKQPAAINANGDTAAPPTGSFWARLFSSGAAAAGPTVAQPVNNEKSDSDILANDAAVLAPLSDRAECSSAAAESDSQTARNISPTFSMLLLSDLGELLSHLRVETINQLDGANAEQFPSSSYGKLSFHRTKHMFEEELRTALADIRKHANNKNNAPVLLVDRPALKKVEEADDALAAIEKEEKKDEAVNESTVQSTPSVSYASVVAASVGAATSSSSAVLANPVAAPAPAAQFGAVPSSSSSSPARSFATEKKSADWSSPAAFSMSDASVTQVLNMCQELGFRTDSTKVKYFMSKSNGDYAALIDWLMTDSLVKLNVPK